MEKKGNPAALLPIGVFLVLFLGAGILFNDFYAMPIVVAFLAAILVACLQNRKVSFDEKLGIMAQGVGDKNIVTMLLIFLVAGAFVGVVGRSSVRHLLLPQGRSFFRLALFFFLTSCLGRRCLTGSLFFCRRLCCGTGRFLPLAGHLVCMKHQSTGYPCA